MGKAWLTLEGGRTGLMRTSRTTGVKQGDCTLSVSLCGSQPAEAFPSASRGAARRGAMSIGIRQCLVLVMLVGGPAGERGITPARADASDGDLAGVFAGARL